MTVRFALIGCGAIGTALLELVQADADLQAAAIVVPPHGMDQARSVAGRLAPNARVTQSVPFLGVDLIVEAGGHSAIEQHVLPALQRGVPAIVASVGALSAHGLPEQLEAAARDGGTQVQLIAGAIGAIDALAAARIGGLETVRYTGRKPPLAWRGTPAEQGRELKTSPQRRSSSKGLPEKLRTCTPKMPTSLPPSRWPDWVLTAPPYA